MRFNVNPLVLLLALAALAVAGVTNFDSITLDSDLIVGDDATITDDLTVTGLATVGETLSVTGAVTASGRLSVGTILGIGGCPSLAAASALAPTESCHTVTGSTGITSITTGNFAAGDVLALYLTGGADITEGNDLVMAGNFTTGAGDTILFIFDGGDFVEFSRVDNSP